MVGDLFFSEDACKFHLADGSTERNVVRIYHVSCSSRKGMGLVLNDMRLDTQAPVSNLLMPVMEYSKARRLIQSRGKRGEQDHSFEEGFDACCPCFLGR